MNKQERKSFRKILLFIPLAAGVTYILINLVSLTVDYNAMKQENAQVKAAIQEQELLSEELTSTLEKLNDPDYLKSYAKENYLYSENGTIIIRIPEEEEE